MPSPRPTTSPTVLIVALGHGARHDDGVGAELVRRLEGHLPAHVATVDLGPNPLRLLEVFERAAELGARVIVIDAVVSGADPGTIHRFTGREVLEWTGSVHAATSSHGFDLATTLALADRLDRLPDDLVILGVEVGDVSPGEGLSSAVRSVVERALARLVDEMADPRGETGP